MSSEFYFRRVSDTSPWQVRRIGGFDGINYHASYRNIKLKEQELIDYKDWLNITKSRRRKLFVKYSAIPDTGTSFIHFIGVNFTIKEDPVLKTVPQTPQLNAMCDYISTQAISIGSTAYHRGDLSEVLNIPRTDLVIMDDVSSNKTKKGNTMFDYDDDDCDCVACHAEKLPPEKRYLVSRTNGIESTKRNSIPGTYHLNDDPRPGTANELIARITGGKYSIQKDRGDTPSWPCGMDYITWRDPAVPADEAGAQKAREALEAAVTKTMDSIVASDVAAGLSAVQSLEAQTF